MYGELMKTWGMGKDHAGNATNESKGKTYFNIKNRKTKLLQIFLAYVNILNSLRLCYVNIWMYTSFVVTQYFGKICVHFFYIHYLLSLLLHFSLMTTKQS